MNILDGKLYTKPLMTTISNVGIKYVLKRFYRVFNSYRKIPTGGNPDPVDITILVFLSIYIDIKFSYPNIFPNFDIIKSLLLQICRFILRFH